MTSELSKARHAKMTAVNECEDLIEYHERNPDPRLSLDEMEEQLADSLWRVIQAGAAYEETHCMMEALSAVCR